MAFRCFKPSSLRGCFKPSKSDNGEDKDDEKRGPRGVKDLPPEDQRRDPRDGKAPEVPEVTAGFTRYTVDELVDATDSFNEEWKLGEGGFAKVYLAELGGHMVAIKRLDTKKKTALKQFEAEIALREVNHPNLLKVLGSASSDDELLLVYEYMQEGSLQGLWDKINANPTAKPLDWKTRLKIAHGVAKGLNHLHTLKSPIIHRDLKCDNILLTADYQPKIADFGLARALDPDMTHVITDVMGTFGYWDPDYVTSGLLTAKSDVYSFGIILLRLLTGREVNEKNELGESQHIKLWAEPLIEEKRFTEMVDPCIKHQCTENELRQAFLTARNCIVSDVRKRNSSMMAMIVLWNLLRREETTASTSGSKQPGEAK